MPQRDGGADYSVRCSNDVPRATRPQGDATLQNRTLKGGSQQLSDVDPAVRLTLGIVTLMVVGRVLTSPRESVRQSVESQRRIYRMINRKFPPWYETSVWAMLAGFVLLGLTIGVYLVLGVFL